jgi:hypothetical protein
MSTPDDRSPTDDADAREDEPSPAEGDPIEAARRVEMLALWRAGVASLPEVAWRDAGATCPLVPGVGDDEADDEPGDDDPAASWFAMPKVRDAR